MSLVWLALIGVVGPIKVFLHSLQTMDFFREQGMTIQTRSQEAKDIILWGWDKVAEAPRHHGYA